MVNISMMCSLLMLFLLPVSGLSSLSDRCPRGESKLIRQLISTDILPIYHELGVSVPVNCPLAPSRNLYGYQEDHKYEESPNKWVCNFCGKAFYEERFINFHFINRHSNTIRTGEAVVCLADYCDVFRCEVISKKRSSASDDYWDRALCRENDLKERRQKCENILHSCVPKEIDATTKTKLLESLNLTLCVYLTCDNYWELPDSQMSPLGVVYYIVATMVLMMGLVIYFVVLKAQLAQSEKGFVRSDSESDSDGSHGVPNPLMYAPQEQEIRHRLSHNKSIRTHNPQFPQTVLSL